MKVVRHRNRANRLMRDAIRDLELDLRGMAVLTEAASGVFAVTSLIAALAGADAVFAVTRDSDHGSAKEVLEYVRGWATELEVAHALTISTEPAGNFAHKANIVTNLGFVRPIDRDLVTKLPVDSAVSLMWEPWELREEDINLQACHERNIPVLGTWEGHKRLRIFDYLGTLVLKLMFQAEIEVTGARIIMVASEPFGSAARHAIEGAGVFVNVVDPTESRQSSGVGIRESHLAGIDAMVLLEHRYPGVLVGAEGLVHPRALAERGIPLIHICGNVDGDDLVGSGIIKIPEHIVPPGYMTVTTAEVGPRPVIDLHTAGLKVAQAMVEELRRGGNAASAKSAAIAMGLGMDFESRETS